MSDLINTLSNNVPVTFSLAFIYGALETVCGAVLSFLILKQRFRKNKIIPALIMCVLFVSYGAALTYDSPLKDVIGVAMMIIAPLAFYCFSLKKTIESIVIFIGTDMLSGFIAALISASAGSDYNKFDTAGKLLFNLISSVLITVIFGFFIVIDRRNGKEEPEFRSLSLPLYALIIFTASFFTVTMVYFQVNISNSPKAFLLSVLNILLFAVTIFCAVRRFMKSQYAQQTYKKQLDLQIRHFELMEKKNDELRIFRHDMPKKLRPMAMYLESGKTDDALEILEKLNVSIENSRPRFSTGNYRLDTVLESQQQLAEEVGATIKMAEGSVFPAEGIAPEDIYTIFPNALDNAIEACAKCSEDRRIIIFKSQILHDRVYIKIENPCSDNVHSSGKSLITTKSDKNLHGYGFRSIKKAAAKYGSNNVSFNVENGIFTLMISLAPLQ